MAHELSYLERRMENLDVEQLAEILLAIAWSIDLFDTAHMKKLGIRRPKPQ